jgi:hypothetical protein
MRRLVVCAGLVSCLAASPARAQANPGTSDSSTPSAPAAGSVVDEARAAFQEGTLLARQARWVDALQAFERSAALHPHAITTYNIGYCERLLGHWTRARKMLQKALADHKASGEVELPPDLVGATQTFLSEADRQIARVLVTVAPEGGAVGVDGRPLELAATEGPRPVFLAGTRAVGPAEVPPTVTFEVQLDPGAHVFVLLTKGRPDVVASEAVSPGSQIVLELRAPAPDSAGTSRDVVLAPEGASAEKPNRLPALIALGVGAAGLATGTVSGLIAFGKKSAVSNACAPSGNLDSCTAQRDSGNRAADVSTIAFIAGGVGVTLGAVLYLTASTGKGTKVSPAASSNLEIRPWVGLQSLGVHGDF